MNSVRKLHFYFFTIASVFLLSQSPLAMAITVDELVDICEASESAIMDISVEYDWGVEPAPKIEDIVGTGKLIGSGLSNCKWSTKRPFGERFLSMEKSTNFNEHEESSDSTIMQSYNGEITKHVTMSDLSPSGIKRIISRGTITESKRFIPPANTTPISFSILRLSCVNDKIPLSQCLRSKEFVRLDNTIEKINGFNAIHADLLIDIPDIQSMHKQAYLRIYFSVDNGYTPIRYDYLKNTKNGLEISFTVNITSLEKISEGVWFPNKGFLKNIKKNVINTYQANNIVINQGLTDEHFNMEFPPGTKVYDEIAGVTYVIRPSEQQFNDWLENESAIAQTVKTNEKKAVTLADRTATTAPQAEKQQITPTENKQTQLPIAVKNTKNNITIYILAGIVCAISVGLFFVRKSILNRGAQR